MTDISPEERDLDPAGEWYPANYVPPASLKGVGRYGPGIYLTAAQTRMVYIMLGLVSTGEPSINQRHDASYFWFNGQGYGKTTALLTAAAYAKAAQCIWDGVTLDVDHAGGLDMEFLQWYCDDESHI